MKKNTWIIFFIFAAGSLYAQEKRINLYSAYVFDDKFETYNSSTDYYSGKIYGGLQWGVGLEIKPKDEIGIELMYYHQDAKVPISYYDIFAKTRNPDMNVGVSYILLGLNKYLKTGKVEPYGGFLLGTAIFNNQNPQPGEETSKVKFALGARLGVNVWASEKVAVKLQVQFLSSVQGLGGGFYFGTGGSGAGVSTYSSITQLGIGGGLAFKLGQ